MKTHNGAHISPVGRLAELIGISVPPEALPGVEETLDALRDHLALVREALAESPGG